MTVMAALMGAVVGFVLLGLPGVFIGSTVAIALTGAAIAAQR